MYDVYAIEMDTRDKIGGALVRVAMFDKYSEALDAWMKIHPASDPEVQWWFVKIREGIDDPSHIDALEFKCADGEENGASEGRGARGLVSARSSRRGVGGTARRPA